MYTIKQAAARSGVSVPLLRAWERRYGVVIPQRTDANYRLYDDESIRRLHAMRLLVEAGWSAREAAARIVALDSDAMPATDGASPLVEAGDPFGELVDRFADAAMAMDAAAIDRILDAAFATASFEMVADQMLIPALRVVGQRWASGALSVAAEHASSAAVMRRLGMAYDAASRGVASAPILIGLPAGERHEVAALAFAVAARRAGLSTAYLGADVPPDAWIDAIRTRDPRAVVLGVVTAGDVEAATDALRRIGRAAPGVLRAAGGRHAAEVAVRGVVLLPEGIEHAVAALRTALT